MTETTLTDRPATGPTDTRTCASRLRTVLRLNALNSLVFGTLLAAIPQRVDETLDTGHPGWIRIVGIALLPFAALCAWLSTASIDMLRRATPAVVAGDVGWVVASVVTALLGWYSAGGVGAVLAMAAVVALFAVLQWITWRQLSEIR